MLYCIETSGRRALERRWANTKRNIFEARDFLRNGKTIFVFQLRTTRELKRPNGIVAIYNPNRHLLWNTTLFVNFQQLHSIEKRKEIKKIFTLRSLSKAPLVSKVSFPSSSIVTAASLAKVMPAAKGCPGLLEQILLK